MKYFLFLFMILSSSMILLSNSFNLNKFDNKNLRDNIEEIDNNNNNNKPHILLIVLDDIGYDDTGVYRDSNIPTPHLNQLANNGIRLDHYYTQTVCSPTRSSLMSGRYPFRFGMQHRTTQLPGMESHLPLCEKTIPEYLKTKGYRRHMIGKWHVGYSHWDYTPTGRGFESHYGYLQAQVDYYNKTVGLDSFIGIDIITGLDFWRNKEPQFGATNSYSVPQYQYEMKQKLQEYVSKHDTKEKQSKNPLFLYFAHQTVHIPLQSKETEKRCDHITLKSRNTYCAMIVELDDAIGELIHEYKSKGLWDNTLLLLTTDNGGMTNWAEDKDKNPIFPASAGGNAPLRGGKTTLFQGGVKSLGLINGGKNIIPNESRGIKYNGLMHVVDFTNIILKVSGILTPKLQSQLDGYDLFYDSILTNNLENNKRMSVPINIINSATDYTAIVFDKKYKLIISKPNANDTRDGYFGFNGYKIKPSPDQNQNIETPFHLFDLSKDPYEQNSLITSKDDIQNHKELLLKGLYELKKYIKSGFMEPQGNLFMFDPQAFPNFHNGVFAPYLKKHKEPKYLTKKDLQKVIHKFNRFLFKFGLHTFESDLEEKEFYNNYQTHNLNEHEKDYHLIEQTQHKNYLTIDIQRS